jgi:7-cyano-7-deazaguanine synthase in queuosine biosynthesis
MPNAAILLSGGLDWATALAIAKAQRFGPSVMTCLATKASIESANKHRVHTPVIEMSKSEIIRVGLEFGDDTVPFADNRSIVVAR